LVSTSTSTRLAGDKRRECQGHHDRIGDGGDHCGTKALGLLPSTFLFPSPLLPLADHHRLRIYVLHFLLDRRNHRKFKSVCIVGGKSTLLVSSGKGQGRSGSKRVRVPEGKAKVQGRKREGKRPRSRKAASREGNRNGRNESLEAMACERKEGKAGLYCMCSTTLFAGARRESNIQVR